MHRALGVPTESRPYPSLQHLLSTTKSQGVALMSRWCSKFRYAPPARHLLPPTHPGRSSDRLPAHTAGKPAHCQLRGRQSCAPAWGTGCSPRLSCTATHLLLGDRPARRPRASWQERQREACSCSVSSRTRMGGRVGAADLELHVGTWSAPDVQPRPEEEPGRPPGGSEASA